MCRKGQDSKLSKSGNHSLLFGITCTVVSTMSSIERSLIKMPNARLSLSPVFKIAVPPSPTQEGQPPFPSLCGLMAPDMLHVCLGPPAKVHAPPGQN